MSLEKTSRCFLIACTGMILILLSAVSCRWPEAQIELDKKRFGRISTERFPGTSCCPDDSASSKRRRSHPLGPTGGWGPNAGIDTSRRHDTAKNEFRLIGGEIAGYIQFPTSGRLAIRSYDDVYGTVYCGWSPAFVEYEPQPQPVYVAFSLCIVGDGGLDQVHELCWIPEGEEKGVIVFSTAHPEQSELKAHELFLPRHIGVKLLLLKAGLNLFDASSIESLSKVKTILGNGKALCFQNPYASDLVDLYEWAASRVQGMRIPVPPVPERANRVHGYDPRVIAGILLDPELTDATLNTHAFHLGGETNYFWLGLREFLTGNMEEASRYLAQYSSQPNQGMNDFELAATAALQEKMGEKRRVPLP